VLELQGRGVELTTHLHPVPRIRISGAIPPYSHMHSWSVQEQVRLCEIWSCDSGDAEDSSLLGLRRFDCGRVVSDVSEEGSAFRWRVSQFKRFFLTLLLPLLLIIVIIIVIRDHCKVI
jgi:hypothetical protein